MLCFILGFSRMLQQIKIFFQSTVNILCGFCVFTENLLSREKSRCPVLKVRRGTERFGVQVNFAGTFSLGYQGEQSRGGRV